MNKKLFSKLGLLLLSLSLVSCGQKNNSVVEDNSSKSSTNQSVSSTQSSAEEGVKTTSPSVETTVESKQDDKDIHKNTQQETNPDVKQNTTPERFIVAGGHNTVAEVCEYIFYDINVTKRIEPSIITTNSSYYDVETEGNIYIDLILDVNSLSNEAKMANDIITTKIKINNNEYSTFSLVESTNKSDLEKDALINPSEPRKIHYVAELPISDFNGDLEVILTINGNDFSNKFQFLDSQYTTYTTYTTKTDVKQGLTEQEYYVIIKEAKQRQQDYIDSIDDPKVKQSVQTSYSAAIAESTSLSIKYPGDSKDIDAALKRVLNGE